MDTLSFVPAPHDPKTAFCAGEDNLPISVQEAAYLTHHYHLKGTEAQKHEALRTLVNGLCSTTVGRRGLENLLEHAHSK